MGNNIGMLSRIYAFGLTLYANDEIKSASEKGKIMSRKLRG